jgi:hypothetical protein
VVDERIRELRRDRPDPASDPAEVVEQARALRRKLLKERREPEDVVVHVAVRDATSSVNANPICSGTN